MISTILSIVLSCVMISLAIMEGVAIALHKDSPILFPIANIFVYYFNYDTWLETRESRIRSLERHSHDALIQAGAIDFANETAPAWLVKREWQEREKKRQEKKRVKSSYTYYGYGSDIYYSKDSYYYNNTGCNTGKEYIKNYNYNQYNNRIAKSPKLKTVSASSKFPTNL